MADNSYPSFYPPQAQFAYPSSNNTNLATNKVNDSAAAAAAAAVLTPLDPTVDYTKTNNFDFLSFGQGTADVLAPHPDLFESELDSSFATFEAELNLLPVDTTDVFTLLRSETPRYGPPSTFTVSSESVSGYDSSYAESESYYSFNPHSQSPTGYATGAASTFSFPQELDMDFQRLGLPASNKDDARYHPTSPSVRSSPGTVPTIAHYSPQTDFSSPRGSFSDYEPAQPQQVHIGSASSDYYPQVQLNKYPASMGQSTVTPSTVSPQIPSVPSIPSINTHRPMKSDAMLDDPKRKYQCPSCPRGNLHIHLYALIIFHNADSLYSIRQGVQFEDPHSDS